ncbi:MAG TPA: biotin transporter BioY [Streptosporangiaceae bacterium]|nr:biotin transporter BioY [Streptosporangiaceae bacterium]
MSLSLPLQRPRQLVLADLVASSRSRVTRIAWDVALVVGAAALVGILAQVSIHLSFTPVPITGQTLGVLLAGTALGWRRGAAAMALYAIAGLAGVPWFAGHTSGYVGASFGYIVGFFFAAAVCGYLAERGADRSVVGSVPAMLAGELMIYLFGVSWLAIDLHVTAATALHLGFTPFVVGDAIKAAIAAGLLPAAWKLAGRGRES